MLPRKECAKTQNLRGSLCLDQTTFLSWRSEVKNQWLQGYTYQTRDIMFRGRPVGGFARGKGLVKLDISKIIHTYNIMRMSEFERGYIDALLDSVN